MTRERPGTVPATWNTTLRPTGEVIVTTDQDDDESPFAWADTPRPNRKTRRAARRARRA